jgi:LytS/YehU family sensor histidine kinase
MSQCASFPDAASCGAYFIYRYVFFAVFSWGLIFSNFRFFFQNSWPRRLGQTFLVTALAYGLYWLIAWSFGTAIEWECFSGMLIMQFAVAWLLAVFVGHIVALSVRQVEIETENERLRSENLQSRCKALTGQINPHFFFNMLNSLAALARGGRRAQLLGYIGKVSEIFRYILKSDKKGVTTLEDEMAFLDAYRYVLAMRYADKLTFQIEVGSQWLGKEIPILSLLPLLENVVKHNVIDSDNPMEIYIGVNAAGELEVSNPVHEKLDAEENHGIGLSNLESRVALFLHKHISYGKSNGVFSVRIPLADSPDVKEEAR